jgi:hypothetical protein
MPFSSLTLVHCFSLLSYLQSVMMEFQVWTDALLVLCFDFQVLLTWLRFPVNYKTILLAAWALCQSLIMECKSWKVRAS